MKKLFVTAVFIFGILTLANAQSRAIGGRLGSGGVDFSYQHSLSESNMLNIEVGLPFWNYYGVSAAATYDWIFPISSWKEKGSWNWYAGVGAGLGYAWWNKNLSWFNVGVAGRIGVEYNFWFPLQLSLDWRPVIGPAFVHDTDHPTNHNYVEFNRFGLYDGIALGVRYRF